MDLVNEINELCKQLQIEVDNLSNTGFDYANSYREYRVLLSKELLRLKNDKMPVTIAYDIARGDELVAQAKFNELSTEAIYKANLESINAIKLRIKVLENHFDKEYFNSSNGGY